MDDKAKIPIGEPGTPEPATHHNRRALTLGNVVLEASDHDYHSINLTPSVNLVCNIPDTANDSFYGGQIYVGIKDSVFEGSDPLRHMVELCDVLKDSFLDGFPPYLSIFSDGGADHNITFLYVQTMLACMFRMGDFDVLNAGRCALYQSYMNPAERCMSLLNIGLQGLSLQRSHAGDFEPILKSCSSMKAIRNKAKDQLGTKEALHASIQDSKNLLEETFTLLELKIEKVDIKLRREPGTCV
jgi:hypothetical protein